MTISVSAGQTVVLHSVTAESKREARSVALPDYDRERFDDVAFLTAMNL